MYLGKLTHYWIQYEKVNSCFNVLKKEKKNNNNVLSLSSGETKECSEFAKQFLERRSKYKNMQRAANAHIDDMCSPAPAITPVNESQDTKVRTHPPFPV